MSIVIVCRDNPQELDDTLSSIRSRLPERVQTIVVDGSTRNRACAAIARSYSVVSDLLSDPDEGIYDAMNKGIGVARGAVLSFMNSGDRFSDNFVIDEFIDRQAADIDRTVVSGQTLFSVGRRRFICRGLPPVHQAMFFPRLAVEQLGLYRTDMRMSADVEFIDRITAAIGMKTVSDNVCEFKLGGVSTAPRTLRHVRTMYFEAKRVGRLRNSRDKLRFLLLQLAKMTMVRCLGFERTFLLTAFVKRNWTEIEPRNQLVSNARAPVQAPQDDATRRNFRC